MKDIGSWKPWITPLTTFTFAVVSLTGVVMLFGVHLPFVRGFHEWIGLAFAACGLVHLVIHWRTFCAYLKRRETLMALAAVVLLAVALTLLGDQGRGHHGPGGPGGRASAEGAAME